MTAEPVQPSHEPAKTPDLPQQATPTTAPLLLWLVLQLGVTVVAAARIPLAAVYPQPAERLAPHLLLSVQVIAAGMLFPFLLRDGRAAGAVLATAVPFQLAAAYLAGLDARDIAPAAGFVLAWLGVLAAWRRTLPSPRTELAGACLATCLTLGGGILRYLRLEFGPTGPDAPAGFENASPLLTTLALLDGKPAFSGWLLLAGAALAVAAIVAITRKARRQPRSAA